MAKDDAIQDGADYQLVELYKSKEYQQSSERFKAKVKASCQPGPFGFRTKVLWLPAFKMLMIHVACAVGAVVGTQAKWQSYVCYIFLFTFTILGATAGAHRLWCHRGYKAKLPYRIMMMCFNCLTWQGSIYSWSKSHRLHHRYSDTDADPYGPKRGLLFAHIGWLIMLELPHVLIKRKTIDMSDLKKDPVVMFQKRYYLSLCTLFSIIIPTLAPWYFWNESLIVSFFLLFGVRFAVSLHCIFFVNSVAHRWGYKPYNANSKPAENYFVCFTAFGEGYHNYHHAFPFDYSTGEWGPILNVSTCFIDLFAALGQVYDRKQVSQETILKFRQRKGDLSG